MKTYLFIHTLKFTFIAALVWAAISQYESFKNPVQQSLWVYMFIYLPAIVGYVYLINSFIEILIKKLLAWANKK